MLTPKADTMCTISPEETFHLKPTDCEILCSLLSKDPYMPQNIQNAHIQILRTGFSVLVDVMINEQ